MGLTAEKVFSWFEQRKHLIFAILLLAFILVFAENGKYDFWEHAAAIRSLKVSLIHPPHPYIAGSFSPHHFYSPYHVALSQFAVLFNIHQTSMLVYAGFFNIVLFLLLLYIVLDSLCHWPSIKINSSYFFSLLFILFLWGQRYWMWSGFYHFKFLKEQIYLPSAFSLNLMLIAILLTHKITRKKKPIYLFGLVLCVWTSLLSHPNTTISFLPILFSIVFRFKINFYKSSFIATFLCIIIAFMATLAWPYYSFFDFLSSTDAKLFNSDSYRFYSELFSGCWPVIFAFPAWILYVRRTKDYFFIWAVLGVTTIYFLGFFTHQYGLGRSVSVIVMLLQINLAVELANLYEKTSSLAKKGFFLIAVFCSILLVNTPSISKKLLIKRSNEIKNSNKNITCKWGASPWLFAREIDKYIQDDDIVLTRLNLGRYFAGITGRYIAIDRPEYWIQDIDQRRKDIIKFHGLSTSEKERWEIVRKYHPDYIIINKWSEIKNVNLIDYLNNNFEKKVEDNCLVIYKVDLNK